MWPTIYSQRTSVRLFNSTTSRQDTDLNCLNSVPILENYCLHHPSSKRQFPHKIMYELVLLITNVQFNLDILVVANPTTLYSQVISRGFTTFTLQFHYWNFYQGYLLKLSSSYSKRSRTVFNNTKAQIALEDNAPLNKPTNNCVLFNYRLQC